MYKYKFEPTHVIDGVTVDGIIDLGFGIKIQHNIRLLDIKSTSIHSKLESEKALALEAKTRLNELLDSSSNIIVHTCGYNINKPGRTLSRLYLSDNERLSINEILLREQLVTRYGS